MARMAGYLGLALALFTCITTAQTAEKPKGTSTALEKKLIGDWQGGACQGDWTFRTDGTFEMRHFTPGNIKSTGTYEVQWNALPPTLVTTFKTSTDADYVGKTWELKILELEDEKFVYRTSEESINRLERETRPK